MLLDSVPFQRTAKLVRAEPTIGVLTSVSVKPEETSTSLRKSFSVLVLIWLTVNVVAVKVILLVVGME